MEREIKEVEVSWKKAAIVWWAYIWRSIVIIFPVAFLIGAILGVIMIIIDIPIEQNRIYLNILGGIIWIAVSFLILKNLFSKDLGGFRLALIKVPPKDTLDE